MDQRSYDGYGRTQVAGIGRIVEGQASVVESIPQNSRYLQKQRSYNILRDNGPSRADSSTATYGSDGRGSTGPVDGTKARKGSLRHVVRRIFGRRSKEVEPPPIQAAPPRHAYHQSETVSRSARDELSPGRTRDDGLVQRTRSTPIASLPIPTVDPPRTRSPYAMQFPQSSRLKPLDLRNPYTAPGSQLRRRKTLPSVQSYDTDQGPLSASPDSPNKSRIHGTAGSRNISTPIKEAAAAKSRREKRRSRSAGDLRGSQEEQAGSPQKKSEEMRQWRESLQSSVLRASGFTTQSPSSINAVRRDNESTPMPNMEDPFYSGGAKVTPAFQRDMSEGDVGSASAFDTELSRDLEDRVKRLEAGLQNFRGQLALLSADRNRRTVLIGGVPSRPRASSGGRTASLLATDLQQDLEPTSYRYDYGRNIRPTTSPTSPRTPTRTDPSTVTPNFSLADRRDDDDPFISQRQASALPASTRNGSNAPPQHTFRSLYEMLTDERSARRKLEMQMKSLREEIANLHYQVSLQSNVQSQRSSYYAEPMVGSSRLHALLRDTESSRPTTAQSPQQQQESARFSADTPGLVSRFSGTESEIGIAADGEEVQTPDDVYQTPQEGRFPFSSPRNEGAMF